MTAEVCVMNRLGIALAADSAVTLSYRGNREKKIYTSVDKIFSLSNEAPVGVMIYDNASYLEMMWETIVKEFRSRLGARRFDTLREYANEFLDFLTYEDVFPEDIQDQQISEIIRFHFGVILLGINKRLDAEIEKSKVLSEEDYPSIVTDELRNILSRVKTHSRLERFNESTISKVQKKYKNLFKKARDQVFEELNIKPTAVRILNQIGVEILTRDVFGPLASGVVISGFGENGFFPRLYLFRIEGRVIGNLRMVREHESELSPESSASVIPFAQQEMVHTFMRGINPGIDQFIRSTTQRSLIGVIEKIGDYVSSRLPEYKDQIEPVVEEASNQLLKSMFEDWERKQWDYWRPVVDIVESLPKDELASMAEALVNLTKFRRRVTPELETVGGPIDVAVISKGDGFVWVKRKHYFNAALNPRIMARYQMEANHEQSQ